MLSFVDLGIRVVGPAKELFLMMEVVHGVVFQFGEDPIHFFPGFFPDQDVMKFIHEADHPLVVLVEHLDPDAHLVALFEKAH